MTITIKLLSSEYKFGKFKDYIRKFITINTTPPFAYRLVEESFVPIRFSKEICPLV